ncbi:MAG: DNA methyltransferase [Pseudomonadota bacterium]
MRLSWSEIRRRAQAFSEDWKDAHYEKGETQTFYNEFFEIFGIKRARVAVFEKKIDLIDQNRRGFIDLFWPSVLLVEQKSAGKDLDKAQDQAYEYVLGLKDRELPKFVLTCDFQRFRLVELDTRQEVVFTLPELHKHVEAFGFMVGVQRRNYGKQAEVSIKAAELLGKVHDALYEKNYRGIDLERIMVRLLFCMFADDTGIFETKDDFLYLIEERTDEDGGNVGRVLNEVFEVLDTPDDARFTGGDPEIAKFPYVNGDLFKGAVRTAPFDKQMREDLLDCCRFDWGAVSPAIFGSLFQSVMDKVERRKKGAHYTTEPNIMKVIGPLFLDDLRAELEHLKGRRDGGKRPALLQFQEKLGGLKFFDPACGCGNFLVVTYRELRRMEQEALEQIYDPNSPMMLEVEALSVVKLDQFYGIELEEFPAHIAEVAMWMTEHLANIELGRTFGKVFADIPLNDSATIVHGDALETEWEKVLPASECFAVLGNPPFIGAKYQSAEQRQQVRDLADLGKSGGTLDFVCAWFLKAGAYLDKGPTRIGFVSTNSITQGEQVAQLWPVLFDRYGLEIDFAHRTFAWGSDARGKAQVHVVIIGLAHRVYERAEKRLFSYDDVKGEPDETRHRALSAYLFGADSVANRHLVVREESRPINGAGRVKIGSKPIDGGHYIFQGSEKTDFVAAEPNAEKFLRPFVGSREFINGGERWILALHDIKPKELREMPELKARHAAVRAYREASKSAPTRELARTPERYHVNVLPTAPFMVIPGVSSERREYAPFGWLHPPVIPSNLVNILENASKLDFAILTSRMHMAWLSHIGGRLKSDYRYSIGLVYNTFPWPDISVKQKGKIETLAQAVLDARDEWPTSSLADLYDPDTMPANLRKAHSALDLAVDRLYRKKPFESDRDRVEHLFSLYEKLVNPLEADAEAQNKRVNRNVKRRKAK